ncbi:DUF4124 domain-containing protein [Undibacterium pigrum]|uniref:DUF4124 domain-containing protein n=1 Tax=Undibacterium pigrum TaxID=401470 RepID=A0A318J9J8_9BURK|nr:DUF4124 domain-containing protein [Undibacterium pigrum]PXX37332.1 hypothetical protein DFR42_11627 [Undibacterium pigrum]
MLTLRALTTSLGISASLLLCLSTGFTTTAQAQNLYRCGSTYQDKPCDNGQAGQLIKKAQSQPVSDKPPLDAHCMRRGEEAKKIIWLKEGGAFQDKVAADAKTSEQRKLIADVYALRGNSSDIRTKIENDCMADKDTERKFGTRSYEDEVNRHLAAERKAVNGPNTKDSNKADTNEAARKQEACEDIRRQISTARSNQKAGGSVQEMEAMADNKRRIETSLKEMGCSK